MSIAEAFNYPDHSEISVEFTFDAGHRIVGHKGKCARLHGHTYRVHVMAAGPLREPGFVVDFGDIKDLVNKWDHRMLLWRGDPIVLALNDPHVLDEEIVWLDFNPTAELMAKDLAVRLTEEFSLQAIMVELWETPNAMARYIL